MSSFHARLLAQRRRAQTAFHLPSVKVDNSKNISNVLSTSEILLDPRFIPQNQFILDESQFVAAQCSRRSGKSSGVAIRLFRTMARFPGATCMYLALTGDSARDIMWPVIEELDEIHKLGLKPTPSRLLWTHPNGGKLRLYGADMKNFVRRLRGRKSPGIAVDESQEFGTHLEYLIDDVLTPMMADFGKKSWLSLTGTPGPVPKGYFYDVTEKKKHGFNVYKWTLLDNIYLPDPQGFLDDLIARKAWPANHPTLLREWRNQWVVDLESLWIKYKEDINHFDVLPGNIKQWNYILGIDIGYRDADAFAVLAWSEYDPATYLLEEIVVNKQDITGLRQNIERLRGKYNFHKMMIDTGGLGKKIAEELRERYGIPLEAADKTRKQECAEILNDSLRSGRFKARRESRFAQDSYIVQVDWDKSTPDKIYIKKQPHSDIIDAVLYGFKESPAYNYRVPIERPKPGTAEFDREQEEKHLQAALERAKVEKSLQENKSEYGSWKKNKKGIPDWNDW